MMRILCRGVSLRCVNTFKFTAKRNFLSNAYKCSEVWENRLKNPLCQKVDVESVYHQLDSDFQAKQRINVLDVDVLATSLTDMHYQDELEDILIKLRESPECILLPERTTHAVVRLYMDHAPISDFFNVLGNRLLYGIFPDNYLSNLMMDKYHKEKDYVSAVKVAVLQMLQEDTEHPITKVLALHSCYKYLSSSQVWEIPVDADKIVSGDGGDDDDDEEEVIKVRVNYLKNPYHDDHFDLKNVNHLVGKTLWMFGISVGGNLGISSQLVGFILHEKYDKALSLLNDAIENNSKLYLNAVQMAKDFIVGSSKQEAPSEGSDENENKSAKNEKQSAKTTETNSDDLKNKIMDLLNKLNNNNLIGDIDMSAATEKAVVEAVKAHQEEDIANQCQIYQKWEEERENDVKEEVKRAEIESLTNEIQKVRDELKLEEEKLFFFDHEDELEMAIEDKIKRKESMVFYKDKKAKDSRSDDYNPPDVIKRKS